MAVRVSRGWRQESVKKLTFKQEHLAQRRGLAQTRLLCLRFPG